MHQTNISQCATLWQKCAHYCYKMVHCIIWDQCITGCVQQLNWPDIIGTQAVKTITPELLTLQLLKWPKQFYCCESTNNTRLWYRIMTAPIHFVGHLMGRCTDWHGISRTTSIHRHVRNMTSTWWPWTYASIERYDVPEIILTNGIITFKWKLRCHWISILNNVIYYYYYHHHHH